MSSKTLQKFSGTAIQSSIQAFAEGGMRRSVIAKIKEPVEAEWVVNPETPHPAASLLKVPLVGALLKAGADGDVSLDESVRPDLLEQTCYPTVRAAFSGSTLTIAELAALSIITSDNAAASLVLKHLPPKHYFRFLTDAGCDSTDAPQGFGDDCFGGLSRVRTTARDQLRILEHVWETSSLNSLRDWMSNNIRNSRLSARIDPPSIFAHKTGTLDGVAHDVGLLTTPVLRTFIVVLSSNEHDPVTTSAEMADLGCDLMHSLAEFSS